MPMTQPAIEIPIREFAPGDEAAFKSLNLEWLHRYFAPEAKDEEIFAQPEEHILKPGGKIFLAIAQGRPIGCCALIAMGAGEYEVVKMAVTESFQGSGIGRKLLERTISEAWARGAKRLYLETNHILTPAIRLYESLGFRHLPQERVTPSPYARADVYMELFPDSQTR